MAAGDPARLAIGFAHVLRLHGMTVPIGSAGLYVRALDAVGIESRDTVYWAGRATLVQHREDIPIYEEAFDQFWLGVPPKRITAVRALAPETEETFAVGRYSATEILRRKDFAVYSAEDFADAARLIGALRVVTPGKRTRRLEPAPSGAPDLRRTVRRALRTEGEPITLARRHGTRRPRRLVLVLDISGSMEPYARALLRFAHAASIARDRLEIFALGTRLTRLTRHLRVRDPDQALAAVSGAVPDWSGGTRLGEGLRRFNDEWAMRGVGRGAVVVILSDGWDRGDPEVLGTEMARLHRIAHLIVWVNPLKASPGYEPLAGGMAAALPWVDHFVEGHSVEALESLAGLLSRQ